MFGRRPDRRGTDPDLTDAAGQVDGLAGDGWDEPSPGDAGASALGDPLRDALDVLDLGVAIADSDGTISFANRAAQVVLDAYDHLVLVRDLLVELLDEAAAGGSTRRTIELVGPPSVAYELTATPLRPGRVVVVIEDVTERRRVDHVRRDFVANISHEMKTPIGALGLLADTLADETDPESMRRLAGRLAGEVVRISATVDDLLELSRIEFGDEMEVDRVDLRPVLAEAVQRLASAAAGREITVDVMVSEPVHVSGDARQLASAVSNLVDNAIKYSPKGGQVRVAATRGPDRRVAVAVADDGCGIPARDLDRIFERFYRVDRARSRETGGTGLGLSIVRHIAHNHGGEVRVASREGRGSTFTIFLPALPPNEVSS